MQHGTADGFFCKKGVRRPDLSTVKNAVSMLQLRNNPEYHRRENEQQKEIRKAAKKERLRT